EELRRVAGKRRRSRAAAGRWWGAARRAPRGALLIVLLLGAGVFEDLAVGSDRHFHLLAIGRLHLDLVAPWHLLLVLDVRDLHGLREFGLRIPLLHRLGDRFREVLQRDLLLPVDDRAVLLDVRLELLAVLLELDVVDEGAALFLLAPFVD